MIRTRSARPRRVVVGLAALAAALALSTPASAERELFFEEQASAFWAVPHGCADGSTVEGTLLVFSTRDFEAPETEDPDPTARVQFLAVCPDGTSFSWIAPAAPATITSTENLKSVHAVGSGIARDLFGNPHPVTFDVTWTGVGPIETTVNVPGSKRKERAATATGQVTFDGAVLVDGPNNHPNEDKPAAPRIAHCHRHRRGGAGGGAGFPRSVSLCCGFGRDGGGRGQSLGHS